MLNFGCLIFDVGFVPPSKIKILCLYKTMGMIRFRIKFVCVTIGFVGVVVSASAQSKPKQAFVSYPLSLEHLPGYDSLQADYLFESNQFDSVFMNKEKVFVKCYNRYANASGVCTNGKFNDPTLDSLKSMQFELVKLEKEVDSILRKKQLLHDSLLLGSFHQLSVDLCKLQSLSLLLDTQPLFSKEPVLDLTNEFVLFLDDKKKRR